MTAKRLKSEDRKKQILKNAAKIFSTQGLVGSRIKDVANACGINEAVIYKHFRSKEELFKASFIYIQQDLINNLYLIAQEEHTGLEALRLAMNTNITALIGDHVLRTYMIQGIASSTIDDGMNAWVRDWTTRQNDYIRLLISKGVSDGSISPDIDFDEVVWRIKGIGLACLVAEVLGMHDHAAEDLAPKLFNKVFTDISS